MSAIDLSPGSLFGGQFRIVRPLAKGGMGAVYVVEQVSTGRERALKLMHPMLVSDAKSIERFEREAQVGSRIESDHVVEVIAAGVEAVGPTPWICMELLRGETLADRLDKRGLPRADECLEMMKQLAHALGAAHRAGIVHRDLKPENLFLADSRREGVPFTLKVLDFGVATLAQGGSELGGPKTTQGVGSPLWMAPEQTNVGKVVLATDVWALGLIAFQLLTGQSYWRTPRTPGSTITALLVEIMVEELAPASERAAEVAPGARLPEGFDAWFARCVVRDPAARFPDAVAAFPPLLAMLSRARETWPEIAVAPPRMGAPAAGPITAPTQTATGTAPATDPSSFAITQPGPTVASGPRSVPVAAPIPSAPPTAPAPVVSAAPAPRRVWPLVLLGLAAIGAVFLLGVVYIVAQTGQEIAHELASQTPEGHFVDPETGATIDLGPEGLRVRGTSGEPSVDITADGDVVVTPPSRAISNDEQEDGGEGRGSANEERGAPSPEAEPEPAAASEPTARSERASGARPTPVIDQLTAAAERRRERRAPRSTVTAEQLAAFESRVVRMCRTNLDGQPRTRFTVVIEGGIRVMPTENQPQNGFARCVRLNAGESHQPVGTYVFFAP